MYTADWYSSDLKSPTHLNPANHFMRMLKNNHCFLGGMLCPLGNTSRRWHLLPDNRSDAQLSPVWEICEVLSVSPTLSILVFMKLVTLLTPLPSLGSSYLGSPPDPWGSPWLPCTPHTHIFLGPMHTLSLVTPESVQFSPAPLPCLGSDH